MKTISGARRIFCFNAASPAMLEEFDEDYYRQCRLSGEPSVEVELAGEPSVVISATCYVPTGVKLTAVIDPGGVLQVICTSPGEPPIVMREFDNWTSYAVIRGDR